MTEKKVDGNLDILGRMFENVPEQTIFGDCKILHVKMLSD